MKRTPWWLWTLATFVIICIWLIAGTIITAIVGASLPADTPWATLATDLSGFIAFFIATPFVWRYMLGRPVVSLINFNGRIQWRRIGVGFGVWFALTSVTTGVDALINPGDYEFTFAAAGFLPFAAVTVLLLPIQTSAEEFFFRGWLLNWTSSLPRFSQVFISGILFAWPHMGNPEAATETTLALTAYFLIGAAWAYVAVHSGGIELALGAHLANNAFSLLAVGYDDAALPTQAVFTTTQLNLTIAVISLAFMAPAFAWFTRKHRSFDLA